MKKQMLVLISLFIVAMPCRAALNFYQAQNGHIVVEATDCQSVQHLANLVNFPDDPPTGGQSEYYNGPSDTTEIQTGVQTIVKAVLGKDEPAPKRKRSFQEISDETVDLLSIDNFEEHQEALLTFVRDVNWKTGLQITWRDFNVFRRVRMACAGINQLSKPFRVNFEVYTGNLDDTIDEVSDAAVKQLAQAARGHSFAAMSKLSLIGLIDAIDKKNPFLLLAVDEETYSKLVEREPKIAELFEDIYTFFKIRSVLLDNEYSANTDELIRVSKIGKGDSFNTWHLLSEFAQKMLRLNRQGKLNPEDEKELHIWRLESAMHYVKEHVRVEKRAAELAVKDPQNAALTHEVKQGPKKKPSLDEKARELLQKSTQAEIKALLRKYYSK